MQYGGASLGSLEYGGDFTSTITPPVPRGVLAASITINMHQCSVTNIVTAGGPSQNTGVPYGR